MRPLLIILSLFCFTQAFGQKKDTVNYNYRKVVDKPDKEPQYPGGMKKLTQMFLDSVEPTSVKWEEVSDSDMRTDLKLALIINEQGMVEDVTVLRSINKRADQRFINLAKKLKFIPAMKDGKPVRVKHILRFEFD